MDTKEALDIHMDSMVTMAAESDQVCFLKHQGIKLFISFSLFAENYYGTSFQPSEESSAPADHQHQGSTYQYEYNY